MDELKKLWHMVFGDDFDIIDSYFKRFYSDELCATEYINGELCAAAYVMPVGELVNGDEAEKCAHIYAVAVYPKYRGCGYGISVTKKAIKLAEEAGYSAIVIHPAEESLYSFYEKHCGFKTAFYSSYYEADISNYYQISAKEYLNMRETFLKGRPHIRLNDISVEYFLQTGGSFLSNGNSCLAIDDGNICEYLDNENHIDTIPFGMIYGEKKLKNAVFGLTFG